MLTKRSRKVESENEDDDKLLSEEIQKDKKSSLM